MDELLSFLATADPIAERDLLVDEALDEICEDIDLTPEAVMLICRRNEIELPLGMDTRIPKDDLDRLLMLLETEEAFVGL